MFLSSFFSLAFIDAMTLLFRFHVPKLSQMPIIHICLLLFYSSASWHFCCCCFFCFSIHGNGARLEWFFVVTIIIKEMATTTTTMTLIVARVSLWTKNCLIVHLVGWIIGALMSRTVYEKICYLIIIGYNIFLIIKEKKLRATWAVNLVMVAKPRYFFFVFPDRIVEDDGGDAIWPSDARGVTHSRHNVKTNYAVRTDNWVFYCNGYGRFGVD